MKKVGNVATATVVALVMGAAVWAHEITPEKNKQLKTVFPGATKFSEQHAKLTGAQIAAIEKTIRGKVLSKHKNMGILKAESDNGILGYAAFFEAKEPDGDMAPAAVGVGTDGKITKVIVFSDHKDNPIAQESFLGQFAGKDAADPGAWHPNHTLRLVAGREQDSVNVAKAVRLTAAIIVEARIKSGASQKASSGSPKHPAHQEEAGQHHDEETPHAN